VEAILAGQRNIHVRVKGTNELMHEKVFLIDDKILRDGSGNWSVSASRYQDNQVTVTEDVNQIAAFDREFEEMWNRRDNLVVQ
jgi:cardiolipin hydrolase